MQDDADVMDGVEIGRPEGKTSYSGYAERYYEEARGKGEALNASEFGTLPMPTIDTKGLMRTTIMGG